MITSFKIRLKPNNKQKSKMFQSAGVARWAYNWTLEKQRESYEQDNKFLSDGVLRKKLTQLKKTEELKWLYNYSNNIPKHAVIEACEAYKKFFKHLTNRPKFKSKRKSKLSFYEDTSIIKFTKTHVRIQKIGWVRLSEKNKIPSNSKYVNPRVTYDGVCWHISVGIEVKNESIKLKNESMGIDLGIKDLAICSNGTIYKNINKTRRIKRLEKKMRRLQRKVSKKYEINKEDKRFVKTSNIIKLEKNITRLYKHLDNIRIDYRHKVTTEIVRTKPSRIVMESLNVGGMMKNRHLSKAIAQQGFFSFIQMIQYKCNKYGIKFVQVDMFYPSSKTCSKCGYVKPKLSLSERTFVCECCGSVIDRDLNASINLSRYKVS